MVGLSGQKWRDLRVKLSPAFTPGKLRGMFPILTSCGKTLEDFLARSVENKNDVIELRDLMARFSISVISSVAFGVDSNCINESDHILHRMIFKFFGTSYVTAMKGLLTFLAANLFHKIKLRSVDHNVEDFVFSIVNQTVAHREKNNDNRFDFMHLLMQLKNKGSIIEENIELSPASNKLSINQLTANAFVFFLAGVETISSTLSFCFFELARNPVIQDKIQMEIDKTFKTCLTDEITYEMLSDLKYLEHCVDETLRKYPIGPVHFRVATRDYKVADSNLTIPKGTPVMIPVLGLHRDPEIYENPLEFKPERFATSVNGSGNSEGLFYVPFGGGPRSCIGMLLGKKTTMLSVALILRKYNLELNDKTFNSIEIEIHPNQFALTPKIPFNIKITPRN